MKLPFRDWRLLLVTLVLFLIVTVLPAWSLWPVSPPPRKAHRDRSLRQCLLFWRSASICH
jgi:hypothetical protein